LRVGDPHDPSTEAGPLVAERQRRRVEDCIASGRADGADSKYGLSGSVWSNDTDRAMQIASRVRTGTLTLNGYRIEFGAPFGGYKESAIGREFGPEGLSSFPEYKTINLPGGTAH
jgi:acyl-CoA reductase-like NAD-dependent aldehyde dehydrogenase